MYLNDILPIVSLKYLFNKYPIVNIIVFSTKKKQ